MILMIFTGSVSPILSSISSSSYTLLTLFLWILLIVLTDLISTHHMELQFLSMIQRSVPSRLISHLWASGLVVGSCITGTLSSWKYSSLTLTLEFPLPQSSSSPFSSPFSITPLTTSTELVNKRMQSHKKLSSKLGKRSLTFEHKVVRPTSTLTPFKRSFKTLSSNPKMEPHQFKSNQPKNKIKKAIKRKIIKKNPNKLNKLMLDLRSVIWSKKYKKLSKMKKSLLLISGPESCSNVE